MRVEQSYKTPILGVSTLAPRNRPIGTATEQINFRSDPVKKLTKRPSSKWIKALLQGVDKDYIQTHTYERAGENIRYIVESLSGRIFCFVDNVYRDVLDPLDPYVARNMAIQTIEDKTYFVNTSKVVELDQTTDTIEKVAHINVTSALNYGETVQVNITKSTGERHTITYTVPDLGITNPNYDQADKARATKQVALELAARINSGGTHVVDIANPNYDFTTSMCTEEYIYTEDTDPYYIRSVNPNYDPTNTKCKPYIDSYTGIPGVNAVALGSSVAIWEDSGEWLTVEIETGQGDRSTVAINNIVESVEGLPLFAKVGTRITVKPNPTSEKGTYYLEASRIAEEASGEVLEEVVWTEARNPDEPYAFDDSTTPIRVDYDAETSSFSLVSLSFTERKTGDNKSVKVPKFVGNTIRNIGYFQKRLVLLTENSVVLSETDDPDNFWKQSAVQLLVSDAFSMESSAVGIDKLENITPHNRDLLITATNGQFKIDGSVAVTPQTASLYLTTSYECQTNVEPVSIGNKVYFPINYGEHTGLKEYTGQRDTNQDTANSITDHVLGYLEGKIKRVVASANLGIICVLTEGAPTNEVYVYEQFDKRDGERTQQAWSKWVFSEDSEIVDIDFLRDKLTLLTLDGLNLVVKEVDVYSSVNSTTPTVYLDDYVEVQTGGTAAFIPIGYRVYEDTVCIRGTGTDYELFPVKYTEDGGWLRFDEDIGSGTVYIGRPFTSLYEPTRPFVYGEDGEVITTDRLRVSKFILNLVDTNEIYMDIVSDYYETDAQKFNSRFVGGLENVIGKVPLYTGDIKFSYAQDANLATARFYSNNHLGCSIVGISWEGQYHKSKGRL